MIRITDKDLIEGKIYFSKTTNPYKPDLYLFIKREDSDSSLLYFFNFATKQTEEINTIYFNRLNDLISLEEGILNENL